MLGRFLSSWLVERWISTERWICTKEWKKGLHEIKEPKKEAKTRAQEESLVWTLEAVGLCCLRRSRLCRSEYINTLLVFGASDLFISGQLIVSASVDCYVAATFVLELVFWSVNIQRLQQFTQ